MHGHDLLIKGATVFDGTGRPPTRQNVYIKGDRIASITSAEVELPANEVLDAEGLCLSPGFIDVHTHDDMALIVDPLMPAKISQGVTTVVTGLCGYSAAPLDPRIACPEEYGILIPHGHQTYTRFKDYLAAVEQAGPSVNSLALVGHSTLRLATMDRLDRNASQEEIRAMKRLLEEALAEGAAGMSSGLAYSMAKASSTNELVELCTVMAPMSGFYVTHVRDEADGLLTSVEEALAIGRAARVPVVLSHHKALGAANHGRTLESLALVDAAGQDQPVGLDVYPYTFSSTSLTAERVMRGGEVIVTRSQALPEAAGQRLSDIAAALGCTCIEAVERIKPAGALFHLMSEDDVRRVLVHPRTMIGSDGLPFDPVPHPRLWGSFPRVIGHYARDLGLLPVEQAIHKMSGLPAGLFRLEGRGVISVGAHADLVLFDLARISDRATASQPCARATGIERVWINGREPRPNGGMRLRSARAMEWTSN